MLILGLDPGSLHTGFGFIEKRGSELTAREWGRISTSRKMKVPQRLAHLGGLLDQVLDRERPDVVVLETPFHGMNSRSLIVLAQARGVLLARAAERELEIVEYSPAEVKSSVTGNGRADKQQVARMVRMMLNLEDDLSEDTSDALAVAICCAQRYRLDRLTESLC
ncbi:MAG: crossover junction endodeoxyribonuclease RuvC [Acidobacteriota bacterium]